MQATAKLKYLRISPRKVRLVADLIRGKKVEQAQKILQFSMQKSAVSILKVLNSAVANAKTNLQLEPGDLLISEILVNGGPMLKRWRPRSRGQAYPIQKKSSHIKITVREISGTKTGKIRQDKKTTKAESAETAGVAEQEKTAKTQTAKPKLEEDTSRRFRKARQTKERRGIKKMFKRTAF